MYRQRFEQHGRHEKRLHRRVLSLGLSLWSLVLLILTPCICSLGLNSGSEIGESLRHPFESIQKKYTFYFLNFDNSVDSRERSDSVTLQKFTELTYLGVYLTVLDEMNVFTTVVT